MNNIYPNPAPLRQKFIEYLTLNRKAERTVHCYVSFIYALAKHCRRSPDLLGPEDIRQWLYYLIAERKQAASTVNLATNRLKALTLTGVDPERARQAAHGSRQRLGPAHCSLCRAALPGRSEPPPPTFPLTSSARRSRFVQPAR